MKFKESYYIKFAEKHKDILIQRYVVEFVSLTKIANELNVDMRYVSGALRSLNIPIKTKIIDEKYSAKVLELYNLGKTKTEIYKELKIGIKTINRLFKNLNLVSSHKIRGIKVKPVNWSGFGDISGRSWSALYHSATKRGLEFNITQEYAWNLFLHQNRQCAMSGIGLKMIIREGCKSNNVSLMKDDVKDIASLDRIDSSKGYIEGNVQWVSRRLNMMKRDSTEANFKEMCHEVASYSELTYNG